MLVNGCSGVVPVMLFWGVLGALGSFSAFAWRAAVANDSVTANNIDAISVTTIRFSVVFICLLSSSLSRLSFFKSLRAHRIWLFHWRVQTFAKHFIKTYGEF